METENKRLIVIGDSFAALSELEYLWQLHVAKALKRDLINVATNGAAPNWLILKLAEIQSDIRKDDLIVFVNPYWERHCVLPDSPDLTSSISFTGESEIIKSKWEPYDKNTQNAFRSYFTYLDNDDLKLANSIALVNFINSIGSKLTTNPLILRANCAPALDDAHLYNNCSVADGDLFDICVGEFKNIDTWLKLIKNPPFVDFRTGHLSEPNHKILAEKIVNYFISNKPVDLGEGFVLGFIDDIKLEKL